MKNRKYYIAYGSNLNLRQMALRCPTAKVFGTGMVKDYQLIFCRVATIVPNPGGEVPVAIWEIDEASEKALDRYEGYPHLYRKEYLPVKSRGKSLEAMVYIMNSENTAMPAPGYLNTIVEGYNDVGLDTYHLETALQETLNKMKK